MTTLTNEQIAAIIAHFNGGDAADYDVAAMYEDGELVSTHETLAHWRSAMETSWAECRRFKETTFDGVKCIEVTGAQVTKGAQRRDFIIFENGEKTTTWGV